MDRLSKIYYSLTAMACGCLITGAFFASIFWIYVSGIFIVIAFIFAAVQANKFTEKMYKEQASD